MSEKKQLQRRLNPIQVWALAFGCIVGWGAFINPGVSFLPNSGVAGTAIAMVVGALVMVIIAFSYAYMVPKYPKAGGEFTFTRACFGRRAAYVCGWFLAASYLATIPMNATAIGLIVDGMDGSRNILKWGFHYRIAGYDVWAGEMLLIMAVLIGFAVFNILGVEKAGYIQTILAVLLAGSVLILVIAAIISPETNLANLSPIWGFDRGAAVQDAMIGEYDGVDRYVHSDVLSPILTTLAITPWAYVGFDTIPQAAEEFRFSYRKIAVIMIVAIAFGCLVYVANTTIAAAALQNWPDLIVESESTPWLLLAAAERLLGFPGRILVGVSVLCAVLSGIMGFYLASSRLIYSMSLDGYLPPWFGQIDARYGTPRNAILFCMVVSLSGPVLGREALGWFVDMSSIGAAIGYLCTCCSTVVTIQRDGDGTAFVTGAAVIGAIAALFFIALQMIPIPGVEGVCFGTESYLLLIVWIILGALFYGRQRRSMN